MLFIYFSFEENARSEVANVVCRSIVWNKLSFRDADNRDAVHNRNDAIILFYPKLLVLGAEFCNGCFYNEINYKSVKNIIIQINSNYLFYFIYYLFLVIILKQQHFHQS